MNYQNPKGKAWKHVHLNPRLIVLVTDLVKEGLQSYRDLSDHAVRKDLQKATDSNSDNARIAAIGTLIDATVNSAESEKLVQLRRTLTFLRTKLKNEKIDVRIAVLTHLLDCVCH